MRLFFFLCLLPSFSFAAPAPSFVNEVTSEAMFNAMANDSGGSVRAGKVVKFLIDNRAYPKNKIYYINGQYCEGRECPVKWVGLHYDFAEKKVPSFHVEKKDFENSVYYQNDLKKKKFIAGRVQTFEIEKDGQTKTFYGVWFFERDIISEESIQYAVSLVKSSFRIPDSALAFVSYSQAQTTDRVRPWFEANNVALYSVGEILANVKVMPLNFGEAWGFLRFAPNEPEMKKSVMDANTMRNITYIARQVEEAYCAANKNYFPGRVCSAVSNSTSKPRALDMELKLFTNGEILFKQFRQFSGH